MWTDGEGYFYVGDQRPGDRAATPEEIAAWEDARVALQKIPEGRAAATALIERRAAELEKSPDLKDQIEGLKLRLQLLGG